MLIQPPGSILYIECNDCSMVIMTHYTYFHLSELFRFPPQIIPDGVGAKQRVNATMAIKDQKFPGTLRLSKPMKDSAYCTLIFSHAVRPDDIDYSWIIESAVWDMVDPRIRILFS